MKPQSSIAKGNAFEVRVHDSLQLLIENGDFYVRKDQSKIHWKKKYYSVIRQKDITFDLAIEVFLSGSEKPSLVIVIECKDYKSPVPVDDIEEFDSKLGQLVGQRHCLKGIVVTSNSFDSGAVSVAKNVGIGLAQMAKDDSLDWIVPRKDIAHALSDLQVDNPKQLSSTHGKFLAYDGWKLFRSLPSLLIDYKVIDKYSPPLQHLHIPFRSPEEIEEIIEKFPYDELYSSDRLDDMKLRAFIRNKYDAKVLLNQDLGLHDKEAVLGHLSLDPPVISLSRTFLDDVCRMRFTLAHEVGHLVLHRDDLIEYVDEISDLDRSLGRIDVSDGRVNRGLETQANIFASRLLLPTKPLLHDVAKYFEEQNLHKSYIYADNQPANRLLLHNLLQRIKNKYLASKRAVEIRLKQLGLIVYP